MDPVIRLVTPWPALLVEMRERILFASDFHLGLEYELAKMGISIPYQTERILNELLAVVREVKPDRLVLLGDVKHGVPITSFMERREIPRFFEALKGEVGGIDVARGNHDANIQQLVPEWVTLHHSRGFMIEGGINIAAMHGHAWPYPEMMSADLLVLGHNHPTVLLRTPLGVRVSQRVWVKGQCSCTVLASSFLKQYGVEPKGDPVSEFEIKFNAKVGNPQMVLVPSFNDLLGGMPINGEAPKSMLSPILHPGAVNMDEFDVYLLDGTFLGSVRFLRTLV